MRAAARLLPALVAAWISTPAAAQASKASAPVTVAVRIGRAAAGAYRLVPAGGVRAVTPLTGDAAAGDLPLTFFLPPALGAGRQRIASLRVGGETLAVWYDVPERRAVRIPRAPDLELLPGTTRRIDVSAENLGNVDERMGLALPGAGLAARAIADSVTIPAGGSASFVVEVTVPRAARAGTSYQVPMVLTAGALSARGQQRITVPVHRRTVVPVEVGTAASLDGSPATAWVYGDFALSDSVRVRAGIASGRSAWPGLAGRRPAGISVTAPGWRLDAGELTLTRPTELVPWFAGTGGRVELGRPRGWSVGGSWLRDVLGGSAGIVSASMRRPGLHVAGALLSLQREGEHVLLPTLGASAWGRTARGDVSAGLLHSASGWTPLGSARGQLTAGTARIFGSVSHTADPAAGGLVLATSASAGVDVRLAGRSSLFLTAGASDTERDSSGNAPPLAQSTTLRAGAQLRVGALAVAPAVELRDLVLAGGGERSTAAATTALTWDALPGVRVRTEAGWEAVTTAAGTTGRPRAGAEISWTGAPGFASLLTTYGGTTGWAGMGIAPTLRAQLQAGFRGGWGSFDATAAVERQARGVVSYGSATASLRVRSETDVLLGLRRVPRLGSVAPWEVTLGLRSTLSVPVPQGPDRRIVFDDENGNGTRDPGESGIPGLQLRAPAWSGVTDHQGRFVAPEGAEVVPDLSALGPGWRIGSVGRRGIGLLRRGSIRATAYFADPDANALERVPRGSIVLVGSDGAAIAAETDAEGSARWSDLQAGRYRLYHVAPGAPSTREPDNAVAIDVIAGAEAFVRVRASYRPRRVVVRQLDDAPPFAHPPAAEPSPADTTAVRSYSPRQTAAPTARCATPSPDGAVRPGMDEAALRCLLGDPDRVSRRGGWSYWFYARSPAAAGGVYDDIVFVRGGRVATAILRERGRRYDGPPPHQQLVEALRGTTRER